MTQAEDITGLLIRADQGDPEAHRQLYVRVIDVLKAIARKRKQAAPNKEDVSTTVLVHDAWLKLVGQDATTWNPGDRSKFFGYVSRQVHDLLIDAFRKEEAIKRPPPDRRDAADPDDLAGNAGSRLVDLDWLIDLRDVLNRYEKYAREDATLFRNRFFLGCTLEECAKIMGMSLSAVKRADKRAQAWLQRELKEYRLDT